MSLTPEQIGQFARAALEQEAVLSPKPGLVDAENCGAHKDMDVALLLASAGSRIAAPDPAPLIPPTGAGLSGKSKQTATNHSTFQNGPDPLY